MRTIEEDLSSLDYLLATFNTNMAEIEISETKYQKNISNIASNKDKEILGENINMSEDVIKKLKNLTTLLNIKQNLVSKGLRKFNQMISKKLMKRKIFSFKEEKESYCICKADVDDMGENVIACDNGNCKTVWFHRDCVKVDDNVESWICLGCKKELREEQQELNDLI